MQISTARLIFILVINFFLFYREKFYTDEFTCYIKYIIIHDFIYNLSFPNFSNEEIYIFYPIQKILNIIQLSKSILNQKV